MMRLELEFFSVRTAAYELVRSCHEPDQASHVDKILRQVNNTIEEYDTVAKQITSKK